MLLECLSSVADPRRAQGRRYPLSYVLLFSILAMLCGATSYRKIQRFIDAHREHLNEMFTLQWSRAPAHTSIRQLLQSLDVNEVERAFRAHSAQLRSSQADTPSGVALDGKVLRGSFDRFEDQKAAQLLSAFCQQDYLILGHLPVASKTNEIPVAQSLIEALDLKHCIYTLDALHCQKKTLQLAKQQGNQVIVQVKPNQPTLFERAQHTCAQTPAHSQCTQFDHRRNRIEQRHIKVFEMSAWYDTDTPTHAPLIEAVIQVRRDTQCFDTRTGLWTPRTQTAYYVSTQLQPAELFAQPIRAHWGIENRNHYVRDVTLREDASRIRRNPGIFARLRSFTLNILRKNKVTNVSQALFDNALRLDKLWLYQGIL